MERPKNETKIEALVESYRHAEARRTDLIDRVWETAKFFTTILSALMTATITLTALKVPTVRFAVVFLPVLMFIVTVIGLLNLRREYRRFLEAVVWLKKIEKYLGLHNEVDKDKRYFKEEKHLLPERYVKSSFESSKDFINDGMSLCRHKDTIHFWFTCLFLFYILISFFLLIVVIFIF